MRDKEAELQGERHQRCPCYNDSSFQFHDLLTALQISTAQAAIEARNADLETKERSADPFGADYYIAATHYFPSGRRTTQILGIEFFSRLAATARLID